MKMLFEDSEAMWAHPFDIYDEIGRRLFHVAPFSDETHSKLKIYDTYRRGKSIAVLRCGEDGVEIKHGTRYVATVRLSSVRKGALDLDFLNWCAVGNLAGGAFRIYDANGRIVASVTRTPSGGGAVRCVDSLPEFHLHALTFTLAALTLLAGPLNEALPEAVGS